MHIPQVGDFLALLNRESITHKALPILISNPLKETHMDNSQPLKHFSL